MIFKLPSPLVTHNYMIHYYYILLFIGIITIIYKYIFMLYYILYILCYFYILSNNNITIISSALSSCHCTLPYLIYLFILCFCFLFFLPQYFFMLFYCIVFYCIQIYRLLWQLNFPSGMNKVLYLSIYLFTFIYIGVSFVCFVGLQPKYIFKSSGQMQMCVLCLCEMNDSKIVICPFEIKNKSFTKFRISVGSLRDHELDPTIHWLLMELLSLRLMSSEVTKSNFQL